MAWIESHQDLGHHPKLKKLCRVLNISQPQAVGHLQYFWWWSVDYCEDGDLSRFDALDIAIGAMWEGDPQEFLNALVLCGWIDSDHERRTIHDWDEYIGRLIDRRAANAERMRAARAAKKSARTEPVQRTCDARSRTSDARAGATQPNPTKPNRTEPKTSTAPKPDSEPPDGAGGVYTPEFLEFWSHWPKKGDAKLPSFKAWRNLTKSKRAAAMTAIPRWLPYYRSIENRLIPNCTTWLNQARWEVDPPPIEPPRPIPIHRNSKPDFHAMAAQLAAQEPADVIDTQGVIRESR